MWQGLKAGKDARGRGKTRRARVDVEPGIFVTEALKIEQRGVEDWKQEAADAGAELKASGHQGPRDPQNAFIQGVLNNCNTNARNLAAEARNRLSALTEDARGAAAKHVEAEHTAREAEEDRQKRKTELDRIDRRVGPFGPVARVALLTFGFVLEGVLVYLASAGLDFTEPQRYMAAVIVGAIVTIVVHEISAWLTKQFLRGPSRLGQILIILAGGVVFAGVAILLTGLAVVRSEDFPILQDPQTGNPTVSETWILVVLAAISFLGTFCAAVVGVAHGIAGPLRDANKEYERAKKEKERAFDQMRADERRSQTALDRVAGVVDAYTEALDSIPHLAAEVGNTFLEQTAQHHVMEREYSPEIDRIADGTAELADSIRTRQNEILAVVAHERKETAASLRRLRPATDVP